MAEVVAETDMPPAATRSSALHGKHGPGVEQLSVEQRSSLAERVQERGARVRARGKVGLYYITGIKETQNGTRAAPTRARITSTLTQHA